MNRGGIAPDTAKAKKTLSQFLTFGVGESFYGIDIMNVTEIKGYSSITHLPDTPSYMLGIMNLRGVVVPIFDLKQRFTHIKSDITHETVIIVLSIGGQRIGILVDAVSDIIEVDEDEIKHSSTVDTMLDERYMKGIYQPDETISMIIIIDVISLLKDALLRKIEVDPNLIVKS
jgi:purine-binding chemotaxis protein CheW